MTAFLLRMPAGIPGTVTRDWEASIEPAVITPTSFNSGASSPTAYGVPLVVDATGGNVGNMRVVTAGDAAIYGVLARPFPTGASQDPLGTSTPPASGPCDVLKKGYISVLLSGTQAAVKGGQVYVWTAAPSGSHITGGWEAANPGGSGISIPNAYFMGPADASGNTEIRLNL